MDILTKEQRSYNMSMIRSRWTSPEKKIHNILKGRKIKHEMHPEMTGSPDLIIPDRKTAVFVHGCFWHRCTKHYVEPQSRRDFWLPKIERNVKRDDESFRILRKEGWKVVRIWEHDIRKNPNYAIGKIIKSIS